VLERLNPSPGLRTRLLEVVSRISSFDRAGQERAALPLLRLFGLACADGARRRHAVGPGSLAARFKALLGMHETLAGMDVDRLTALCAVPDFQHNFEAIFIAMSLPSRCLHWARGRMRRLQQCNFAPVPGFGNAPRSATRCHSGCSTCA
jgi:hypothetical protein